MFFSKANEFIENMDNDDVFVYAAQASFYMMISVIPFLMLILSLVQFVVPVTEQDVVLAAATILPEPIMEFVRQIVGELFLKGSGSLISITAFSALWSASRGVAAVERGIKKVCNEPLHDNFFVNIGKSMLYTLMFIIIIAVSLGTFVFGKSIENFFLDKGINYTGLFIIGGWIKNILFFTVVTLFFALVYKTFGGKKVRFGTQIIGAAVAAIGWTLFSQIFSLYINNFSNYSYIYGSLTALVLLELWLYSCMIILLAGAEVNKMLRQWRINKMRNKLELKGDK